MASTRYTKRLDSTVQAESRQTLQVAKSNTSERDGKSNEHESAEQQQTEKKDEVVGDNSFTGLRLYLLCGAIFFSVFLIAMNGSIIATVSLRKEGE